MEGYLQDRRVVAMAAMVAQRRVRMDSDVAEEVVDTAEVMAVVMEDQVGVVHTMRRLRRAVIGDAASDHQEEEGTMVPEAMATAAVDEEVVEVDDHTRNLIVHPLLRLVF